jgi:hypothetical protein
MGARATGCGAQLCAAPLKTKSAIQAEAVRARIFRRSPMSELHISNLQQEILRRLLKKTSEAMRARSVSGFGFRVSG